MLVTVRSEHTDFSRAHESHWVMSEFGCNVLYTQLSVGVEKSVDTIVKCKCKSTTMKFLKTTSAWNVQSNTTLHPPICNKK
jgi:hypothetical protein